MSDEQKPKETAKAFAAFADYCALGSARSLPKLAKKHGESTEKARIFQRQYEKWSSLYNWQERVKQYDAERAEEKRLKREQAREEMEERHASEAKEEQQIARDVIKKGSEKGRISLPAVQLLKNSREDERKALGVDEDASSASINVKSEHTQRVVFVVPKKNPKEINNGNDSSLP